MADIPRILPFSGQAAWEILNQVKVSLLLVDWNMPGLNGIELVRHVRYIERYETLPIIMITSEAAKYNVMEALKAGVSDYIVKPIQAITLVQKVQSMIVQITGRGP